MSNQDVSKVLRLYGQAMRNDWSEIDGRGVRGDLEYLASQIDNPDADTLETMLGMAGVTEEGEWDW